MSTHYRQQMSRRTSIAATANEICFFLNFVGNFGKKSTNENAKKPVIWHKRHFIHSAIFKPSWLTYRFYLVSLNIYKRTVFISYRCLSYKRKPDPNYFIPYSLYICNLVQVSCLFFQLCFYFAFKSFFYKLRSLNGSYLLS